MVYDAGNPKLVLCDNLERWEGRWEGIGKGGGRRFRRKGTHDYGQFMLMYDKNHHNIVKSYPPIKINKYVFKK